MDCLNSGIILRFWVNHGRWEIILVQPGLLHPFNWCKYIFDLVFNTKYPDPERMGVSPLWKQSPSSPPFACIAVNGRLPPSAGRQRLLLRPVLPLSAGCQRLRLRPVLPLLLHRLWPGSVRSWFRPDRRDVEPAWNLVRFSSYIVA